MISIRFISGFFAKNELVGYARIIPPKYIFMIEREFKDLLQNHTIRKERDTVELSRAAINKSFRGVSNFKNSFNIPTMLLYKVIYQWSIRNKIRYWYITIEPEFLKTLQKLFPWKEIGEIKYYQPQVAATAAVLDLREAEKFVRNKNQKLFELFTKL